MKSHQPLYALLGALTVICLSIHPASAGCFTSGTTQPFFEVGAALDQSGIKVHHATGEPRSKPYGLIESENALSLHFSVDSPYQYFESTQDKMGYYCRASFGSYKLSDQPQFNDPRTNGQNIAGYYVFAHPVLFWHFGDRLIKLGNLSVKFGVGVGVGYLSANGDMLIDMRGSIEEKHVRLNRFGLTYEAFVEGRYGNWFLRQIYFGPEAEKDDLIYTFVGSSMQFGYTIIF